MTEQDRAEFEAWAKTLAWSHFTPQFDTDSNDEYGEQATFRLYLCWLAARRTQDAKVRELVEAVEEAERLRTNDTASAFEVCDAVAIAAIKAAQLKEQDDDK